jgi:hypothetical protein
MNARSLVIGAACVLALAGCANPLSKQHDTGSGGDSKQSSSTGLAASSQLVLHGEVVDPSGTTTEAPEPKVQPGAAKRLQAKDPKAAARAGFVAEEIVPDLNSDGTLADGDDPFAEDHATAMITPIERNPETTRDVDAFATSLRAADGDQWQQWLDDRSPTARATGPADVIGSMVRVFTERCGGAKTVASGVVLGDETVVTTVTAIESPERRIRISSLGTPGVRIPAIIRYLDVDDDIAVLSVPGLRQTPIGMHVPRGANPQRGLAFGASAGGTQGLFQRVPVYVAMQEKDVTIDEADGLGKQISSRSVLPIAGPIDTGMAGGAVVATNDPKLASGWGFHGLIRSRVPYRSTGGGLAVPSRLVQAALSAADKLPQWHEFRPTSCPQWYRPGRNATTIR